ncbi:orotate phosphoribosyltransferase-like protein [[Eubacterium] cellulosolvens]
MTSVDKLMKKALDLKSKGLNNTEISDELHLSLPTIEWLLTRKIKTEKPPGDVKIGWRSIGVYPYRVELISLIMTDIIVEETTNRDQEISSIVGIGLNGIPFASFIANNLEKELIIYRPHRGGKNIGVFSSNFAGLEKKNVVIVDDVMGTGETLKGAIKAVEEVGSKPILCLVLVNKTEMNDLNGIPLRALIRTRLIT